MTRYIKRGGKVWIKIFPDKPVTEKPAETRMGSGKGSPEYWVAVVKPGRVLFELADVSEEVAREALRLASHKLPVKCKFVKREEEAESVSYTHLDVYKRQIRGRRRKMPRTMPSCLLLTVPVVHWAAGACGNANSL